MPPEKEIDLHKIAGLVYTGKNEEGEKEYLGTEAEWERYEELEKEAEENGAIIL